MGMLLSQSTRPCSHWSPRTTSNCSSVIGSVTSAKSRKHSSFQQSLAHPFSIKATRPRSTRWRADLQIHFSMGLKLALSASTLSALSCERLALNLVQGLHALSTPLILLAALVGIIVVCTVVMVADFHIKKAKYRKWKALPPSGLSTPTKVRNTMTAALIATWTLFQGCLNLKLAADRQLFPSLSTISDYVPLVQVALLLSCIDFPILICFFLSE